MLPGSRGSPTRISHFSALSLFMALVAALAAPAANLCIADFSYNAIFGSPTALLSG
jgi:methyl coenzyme M reductase alpha subunit